MCVGVVVVVVDKTSKVLRVGKKSVGGLGKREKEKGWLKEELGKLM